MKKYVVYGTAEAAVSITVNAESEEDALEKASVEFKGIHSYCGNGGTGKLIGVSGKSETIEANVVEFYEAVERDM